MNIWDRISHPEDSLTERKPEAAGERDLKETITAFANTVSPGAEGVLFIGVSDKTGEIVGCKGVDSLQKKISKICLNDCYPPIQHQLESRDFHGKTVIAVIIPHSAQRPHFAGHAFRRLGPQNVKSDEAAYSQFIAARSSVGAKILQLKGKIVQVRTLGKKLGNPHPLPGNYSETPKCLIEDCDAHVVTLQIVGKGQRVFEQLENFSLSRDPNTGEDMLLVRNARS